MSPHARDARSRTIVADTSPHAPCSLGFLRTTAQREVYNRGRDGVGHITLQTQEFVRK